MNKSQGELKQHTGKYLIVMKTTRYIKKLSIAMLGILLLTPALLAQETENEFQARTAFDASFKLAKRLKWDIAPELRFEDQFKLDRAQLESELEYKAFDFLSVGARYQFIINYRDKKDTEYLNRYMLSATFNHDFDRWEPSFRLSYTDYTDDNDASSFLRYKGALAYNIKDCKLTPEVAIQGYHDLTNSDWYKVRYEVGFKYKLCKRNSIGIYYKLDYYLNELRNRHILDIGYKLKF